MSDYDFAGYVTRFNTKCADGRTIMPSAFSAQDGDVVPLVWQHQHDSAENVLGHMQLERRGDGIYGYGSFNSLEGGAMAKELVEHGDIDSMSIFANQLKQIGGNVTDGKIREVSLVLSGANPGAYIEDVSMGHAEDGNGEAIIYTDAQLAHEDNGGKPVAEDTGIFDNLTDEQIDAIDALLKQSYDDGVDALAEELEDNDEEVEHSGLMNVFDQSMSDQTPTLSHDAIKSIMSDAERIGSLKESFLAHAGDYGIDDIDILFPDARAIQNTPDFVKRRTEWVAGVINGTHHSPFSRIKTIHADITADEARAKGYVTGNRKKEEVFKLMKRAVSSTTIYKKQKLDRKDVVDITSFDVIAWLKAEMRMMLDEEIARAVLVGDGRDASDDDHIDDECIKPIWLDDDFYALHKFEAASAKTHDFIDDVVRGMKDYRGSGQPTMFISPSLLTELLLLKEKDDSYRRLYPTVAELASAMRVSNIVEVPVLEGLSRNDSKNGKVNLQAIVVNLNDYTIGADKGGEVSFFDDFDIDYNQMKYLYETMISGMLTKYQSALVFEKKTA